MLGLIARFVLWVLLCTGVYYAANYFHFSLWWMFIFAVVSLLLSVLLAKRTVK